MLTSDLIVAVSHSTAADIRTYFPEVGHIPICVAPLGVSVGPAPALAGKCVDYVVVLGTLEPRKNAKAVLECLSRNPELFDRAKFVFIGGWGWGETAQDLVRENGLADQVARGNIVFTGYVSNQARDALVSNAQLVIYPSRYEGFGLPVLESLALGTPVLTSYSSSLPEAGGEVADYCDFDSPDSFLSALRSMLARSRFPDSGRREWAQQFNWTTTYRTIRDAALPAACADESGVSLPPLRGKVVGVARRMRGSAAPPSDSAPDPSPQPSPARGEGE
jgi:glycosyltransferase involved in cell wall biosynthesis